jgi:hypothetical protein
MYLLHWLRVFFLLLVLRYSVSLLVNWAIQTCVNVVLCWVLV